MMISCPRCNEMVSDLTQHCDKCGYSIKNYIENKQLLEKNHFENNTKENAKENNKDVSVAVKEKEIAKTQEVEDNILKFLSNIKIVKDENYDPEDDELDSGMQAFLVEALNDSYRLKSVRTIIKKPKEYFEIEEETSKEDREIRLTKDVQNDLKLSEPESSEELELPDLNIEHKKIKNNNTELNTHELEIIHKRKIRLSDDYKIKDGVIIKDIYEEKNYDKFYNTIDCLRIDKFNSKAILAVASVSLVFVAIIALLSGLVLG